LIFEALPEVLTNGSNILWRHKLHNAACLAGMAIGNASVGVNHALAHSLGAHFDIPHGRANSVFLLTTLEYNSKIPRKFMAVSSYPLWVADQKYARAAQFLNLVPAQSASSPALSNHVLSEEQRQVHIVALERAIFDLAETVGQPKSIVELGISQEDFAKAMPDLVRAAFEDMSLRTNPSCPLIKELEALFVRSYPLRQRP